MAFAWHCILTSCEFRWIELIIKWLLKKEHRLMTIWLFSKHPVLSFIDYLYSADSINIVSPHRLQMDEWMKSVARGILRIIFHVSSDCRQSPLAKNLIKGFRNSQEYEELWRQTAATRLGKMQKKNSEARKRGISSILQFVGQRANRERAL